jgi:hypothetical protein
MEKRYYKRSKMGLGSIWKKTCEELGVKQDCIVTLNDSQATTLDGIKIVREGLGKYWIEELFEEIDEVGVMLIDKKRSMENVK